MVTGTPENIDDYIAGFPPEKRTILEEIRATIRNAAPEAKEVISYRMPTFTQDGVLVHFAAFKNHIGLYPPVSGDTELQQALVPYAGGKGNLRFPLDRPIPFGLIERIVRHKLAQNTKGAKKRRA